MITTPRFCLLAWQQVLSLLYTAIEDEEAKVLVDEVTPGSTAKNVKIYTAVKYPLDSLTIRASHNWRGNGTWYDYCFIRTNADARGAEEDPFCNDNRGRPYHRMLGKAWAFFCVGGTVYVLMEMFERVYNFSHPVLRKYQSRAKGRRQSMRSLVVVDVDCVVGTAVVFVDPDNTNPASPRDATLMYLPSFVELCQGDARLLPSIDLLPDPKHQDDGIPTVLSDAETSVSGYSLSSSSEDEDSSSEDEEGGDDEEDEEEEVSDEEAS